MTNPRFRFLFDDCPVPGGSHHQKFVVVDGTHAFVGGMDVVRVALGRPPPPRREPAADVTRQAAQALPRRAGLPGGDRRHGGARGALLGSLAMRGWRATGRPLLSATALPVRPRGVLIASGPARVALSRTQPSAEGDGIREVERLFVDAIGAAERLIFIETQYFSSRRIREALHRADGAVGPAAPRDRRAGERARRGAEGGAGRRAPAGAEPRAASRGGGHDRPPPRSLLLPLRRSRPTSSGTPTSTRRCSPSTTVS